jgi:hypothetical protein
MNPTPEYSEEYYELLERIMGEEQAAWARLPAAEREAEIEWYHANFDTPDDLAECPPELDGGLHNGFTSIPINKGSTSKNPNSPSDSPEDNILDP